MNITILCNMADVLQTMMCVNITRIHGSRQNAVRSRVNGPPVYPPRPPRWRPRPHSPAEAGRRQPAVAGRAEDGGGTRLGGRRAPERSRAPKHRRAAEPWAAPECGRRPEAARRPPERGCPPETCRRRAHTRQRQTRSPAFCLQFYSALNTNFFSFKCTQQTAAPWRSPGVGERRAVFQFTRYYLLLSSHS